MGTQRRRSQEERPAAMGDAVIDPAFQSLVDQGGDILRGLWRVQKLELVAVPKGQEGRFYEGDCYLHFDKNPNEQHVHFWIGGECSVDEQAVAAIKAVELDNLFGGLPIQHREVQGFESKRFKDQFPDGMMIKKGGMESGLAKAETNAHEAKLFKVAGGMRPVMTEVTIPVKEQNIDCFYFNQGDDGLVFNEPRGRVCSRLWQEDLCLERFRSLWSGEDASRTYCGQDEGPHGRGDCARGGWGGGGRVR